MTLYETIRVRKSVRKFNPQPLSEGILADILTFAEQTQALFPDIGVQWRLCGPDDIEGYAQKAPHYLLFFSEEKPGFLQNAGFRCQQVDLYLSSKGIGACWLGVAKAKVRPEPPFSYVVMLAFGPAAEAVHRSPEGFRRKALSDISEGEDPRLESARLAPSAMNSQPWYFCCQNGEIQVFRKKLGAIRGVFLARMNQIDIGIALCHIYLASEAQGNSFAFQPATALDTAPKGLQCVGNIV